MVDPENGDGDPYEDYESEFMMGPLRLDAATARAFENRSIESIIVTGRHTFGHEHECNNYRGAAVDDRVHRQQGVLRSMASYCSNLSTLILIDVDYSTTDRSLGEVVGLCPGLTTLTVHWRSTLLALLRKGPAPQLKLFAGSSPGKLEHLDLRCLTECLSPAHAAGLAHPEKRHGTPVIGNETLTAIATNCPRLRSLRLQDVKGSEVYPALAVDQGLREIASRVSRLEVLRLDLETAAPADVAVIICCSSQLKDLYSHVRPPPCLVVFTWSGVCRHRCRHRCHQIYVASACGIPNAVDGDGRICNLRPRTLRWGIRSLEYLARLDVHGGRRCSRVRVCVCVPCPPPRLHTHTNSTPSFFLRTNI